MKRFLLCLFLLLVVLVVARALPAAAASAQVHAHHDEGDRTRTSRTGFFDHGYVPGSVRPDIDRRVGRNAPERVGDSVRFSYRDRGYETVELLLEADDWRALPMEYSARRDRWEIEVALDPGTTRYVFRVVDGKGRTRERTDPANPRRVRDEERRWVSEFRVDRQGRIRFERRRDLRRGGRDEYRLDLFADGGLAYQRADGLVAWVGPRFETNEPWAPILDAKVGYGFSSERGMGRLSLLQPLTADRSLRFVISGYDVTDYTDRNGVGDDENSLATLIFREDARDWFRREGISFGVEAEVGRWLLGRVELRSDVHRSLPRTVRAGWTGREDFLPNPAADERIMRSLFARIRFGDELNHLWVEYENGDPGLFSTEFDFAQLTAQYRSRLRAGADQYLDFRLRFGTGLQGSLPAQKRYLAGGIGTVRGYHYQSLMDGGYGAAPTVGGERMALANAEYVMGVQSGVAIGVFGDAGMVWHDREADIEPEQMVASIGLGVLLDADEEGGLRLDLIQPLEGDGDLMLQARLNRPF